MKVYKGMNMKEHKNRMEAYIQAQTKRLDASYANKKQSEDDTSVMAKEALRAKEASLSVDQHEELELEMIVEQKHEIDSTEQVSDLELLLFKQIKEHGLKDKAAEPVIDLNQAVQEKTVSCTDASAVKVNPDKASSITKRQTKIKSRGKKRQHTEKAVLRARRISPRAYYAMTCILLISLLCVKDIFDEQNAVVFNANQQQMVLPNFANLLVNEEITIDPCDTNKKLSANAKVDIGYGNREYYAYTNENAQIMYITAKAIYPQNADIEAVENNGTYCADFELAASEGDIKQTYLINPKYGGVSNSYNLTNQASSLDEMGDLYEVQRKIDYYIYHEQLIEDLEIQLIYLDTNTQVPSSYEISYSVEDKTYSYSINNN